MKNIFLTFGYGVPDDIFEDENYNFYLKIAFNKIYDITTRDEIKAPIIICSGGNTDMQEPYNRTEAGEMVKFLEHLANRSAVKDVTENWQFIDEKESLSALENIINCKDILQEKNIKQANIYVFSEQTRQKRIRILMNKVMGDDYDIHLNPIDFDVSKNRYLDPEFLQNKEEKELKHALWALKSKENLEKHHELLEEKIEYLRESDSQEHEEAVKEWWEKKLEELPQT